MKNALLLLLTCCIYQRSLYAFHKESYYGDPYSMEYVGKFSTVNLTKEDILWADYIVDMLRNTNYTTMDFNASITYPSRFQHMYETGVPTFTTRRFATTSTKSPTKERTWFEEHEFMFPTIDLPEALSSILITSRATSSSSLRLENRHDKGSLTKNTISSLCTSKTSDKHTEKIRALLNTRTPGYITTRKRRSIPYLLNSDSGPWLTSKEQEQVWALRGSSLLDSEKYDFPFPYDFDKWPGCTTKDLTDPKNTIQILEYPNGHVRFKGISKPGWNEFPWKPTDFTTAFPAYRRLDQYLTYLSRPWYGFYSTLVPTLLKKWDKRTTRAWSRYTFGNISWKPKEKSKISRKWLIDKWPPDWNRTIFPQTFPNTWKRTRWGGKWVISTKFYSNASSNNSMRYTSKSKTDIQKSNVFIKKSNLVPQKPTSTTPLKSTSAVRFLSLSPTWFASNDTNIRTYRISNATWLTEWSKLWYKASRSAMSTKWPRVWNFTSDISLMELWSKEISLPLYTIPKTNETTPWLPAWTTRKPSYNSKLYQASSKQWNRENSNQWNKRSSVKWNASSKLNRGGWTIPALTKIQTKQLSSLGGSRPWNPNPYQTYNSRQPFSANRPFYTRSYQQYPYQGNAGREQQRAWTTRSWSSQFRRAPAWTKTNQWGRQQPPTRSTYWNTKPYQYQSYTKQWKRIASPTWSRAWITKPYQRFENTWNKEGSTTLRWSRGWNIKPLQYRYRPTWK